MKRLLLIGSDAMIAELLTAILTDEGYAVDWERTARSSHEYLRTSTPDLIMLDLVLPDANGASILEYCRDADGLKIVPIIVVSGTATSSVAFTDGATPDAMIQKPFDLDDLLSTVKRFVEPAMPCASGARV